MHAGRHSAAHHAADEELSISDDMVVGQALVATSATSSAVTVLS
jgi:hypothetical protein